MDYIAIVSNGTYPNPDLSPSNATRAIFAVSYGLLSVAPEPEIIDSVGRMQCGLTLTLD